MELRTEAAGMKTVIFEGLQLILELRLLDFHHASHHCNDVRNVMWSTSCNSLNETIVITLETIFNFSSDDVCAQ